jgi:hypothetical protein
MHACMPTAALLPLHAAEDMWHAYNLVREGDKVTASTFRKVAKDTGTGADSEKIKLTLTVEVEGIEFDPEGEFSGCPGGWQQQQGKGLAPLSRGGCECCQHTCMHLGSKACGSLELSVQSSGGTWLAAWGSLVSTLGCCMCRLVMSRSQVISELVQLPMPVAHLAEQIIPAAHSPALHQSYKASCAAAPHICSPACSRPPGGTLRVKGRNLTENEYVKLGAYHSLELEQQRAFTVHKACWDVLDIDRIRQSTDAKLSADLAAVLIVVRGAEAVLPC